MSLQFECLRSTNINQEQHLSKDSEVVMYAEDLAAALSSLCNFLPLQEHCRKCGCGYRMYAVLETVKEHVHCDMDVSDN